MSLTKRSFKNAVYGQLARAGRAVSSPKRLELLDLLCQAPRTVEALAKEAEISIANASQHLQILLAGGLVEAEKQGRFVTYRLAGESVGEFFRMFRLMAENRLAEMERIKQRFFKDLDNAEAVDQNTLLDRVRRGEAVVLDVRPREEYSSAHLDGAVSIPVGELKQRLSELRGGKEVVAYCRGPYCVLAAEAVRFLRDSGIQARRLEASVYDWQAWGFPIGRSDDEHALPPRETGRS